MKADNPPWAENFSIFGIMVILVFMVLSTGVVITGFLEGVNQFIAVILLGIVFLILTAFITFLIEVFFRRE